MRWSAVASLCVTLFALGLATPTGARAADERATTGVDDELSPLRPASELSAEPARDVQNAASEAGPAAHEIAVRASVHPPDERWRARGVAFVDLPLGLRARYDVQAFHRLSLRSNPDTAFLDRPFDSARRSARLLESRFAVSRALAPRLELELSWVARSPLSVVDLLRIEDQRVAAMIRLVP